MNHGQLKQSLHGYISLIGHAMDALHVSSIIQLNLSHNSNPYTLKKITPLTPKQMRLEDNGSSIKPPIVNHI
jgi:hypothetical protein